MISLERENYHQKLLFAQQMIEAAIINNKVEIIKLLKQGANPNCYEDMLTPLIVCIDNDNYDLAAYLLNIGASISYNPKGTDALWHALKMKSDRFVNLFVERKCILSLNEETNETALIFATKGSDVKSVEALLKHYIIKVNERDGHGNTALHYNVSKESMTQEDLDIGKMLIAAGADTNATNLEGKTPDQMATDFAARSMILANKLENELPKEKELSDTDTDDDSDKMDNAAPGTKQNKRHKI